MNIITQDIAQQIVDTVKDVSNQNINFIDDKGIIIASTDTTRINTFHEIGYQVVTTGHTIEVSNDDNFLGTKKGINIPITYGNTIIAVIGISGEVEEVRKYAYLAQRITDILLKERELDAQGIQKQNRLNYVIRCLINRDIINPDYLTHTLHENRLSKSSTIRIVLIRLNSRYNPNNLFMIQSAITQALSQMHASFYRYNYPDEYILIAEEGLVQNNLHILNQLALTYQKVLSIGIGRAVNVTESWSSFESARLALNSSDEDGTVILYDDLDFELLLGNISDDVKDQYKDKILGRLETTDIQLLAAYFAHDMSLQKTSQALYIHKNSLQYRLNRIHNVTGYNPRKFRDAVVLYSALKIACK